MTFLSSILLLVYIVIVFCILFCIFKSEYFLDRQDAEPNEAPFIVSIQEKKKKGESVEAVHYGAGVIINKNCILTSAHNLEEMCDMEDNYHVLAGSHNIYANEDHRQSLSIDHFKKHKYYFTFNDDKRNSFDIGLIYTRESIRFTHNVQPIALPDSPEIPEGDVYFFGWGNLSKTTQPYYPDKLQKSLMPTITNQACSQILGLRQIDTNWMCAGFLDGTNSICNGDSGGPLVQYVGNKPILIGLASYGATPCGQINSPSIFTKIHKFIDWIRANADMDK